MVLLREVPIFNSRWQRRITKDSGQTVHSVRHFLRVLLNIGYFIVSKELNLNEEVNTLSWIKVDSLEESFKLFLDVNMLFCWSRKESLLCLLFLINDMYVCKSL